MNPQRPSGGRPTRPRTELARLRLRCTDEHGAQLTQEGARKLCAGLMGGACSPRTYRDMEAGRRSRGIPESVLSYFRQRADADSPKKKATARQR